MTRIFTVFGALSILLAGCGTSLVDPSPVLEPGVTQTGETLTIGASAPAEACDNAPALPDPTWSYQTPHAAVIGVASVELLKTADDPAPHRLLSSSPAVATDIIAGATFLQVDTGSIPEGLYTFMRVKLEWLVLGVDATAHVGGSIAIPGTLAVDYAVSDYNDANAGPRSQGDWVATFNAMGAEVEQAGSEAVDYPPPYPGATVEVVGGEYWVTFRTPNNPILIDHDTPNSVDVDVMFCIEDGFAWEDSAGPGHTDGVFDMAADTTVTERPTSVAVRSFSMFVQP